ncbi:MAG: hypothetical protein RL358_1287 [Pseudomonadota bacterium]
MPEKLNLEVIKRRLVKNRPMTTVTLNLPTDLVYELQKLALQRGYASYKTLLKMYIGQGIGRQEQGKKKIRTVAEFFARAHDAARRADQGGHFEKPLGNPIFNQYADIDFTDAKTVSEIQALSELQARSGDSIQGEMTHVCLQCDTGIALKKTTQDVLVRVKSASVTVAAVSGWHCPVCGEIEYANNDSAERVWGALDVLSE